MNLKEITNKEEWEEFLFKCHEKTFLQSWNWGELNVESKNNIWRFGAYNNDMLISVVLIIKITAKRGRFLFIPHGPIFIEGLSTSDKKLVLELLLTELNKISSVEKIDFIRITPLLLATEDNNDILIDLGFRDAPMHSSAYEATWKLNISASEEEILKNMRKTTRYLIKKVSENADIAIEKSTNPSDIEVYQKLNKEVAERQKFVPFSDDFIKNEFEAFNKDNEAMFLFGKYQGKIVCGAMIIFWSGVAFYHQAASLGEFSKLSIPYLLQWEAIKEAKNRNCHTYDFWGFVDPAKYPNHPWAGPTLFKMGFGGYQTEYVKTQDFVLTNKYWLNYLIEKIRKFRRGL